MFESLKFDDKQIACSQVQLVGFASNEMAIFSDEQNLAERKSKHICMDNLHRDLFLAASYRQTNCEPQIF